MRVAEARSSEVHSTNELFGNASDAFEERWGKTLIRRDVIVLEHNPQAGAIAFFLGADGAGELGDFHRMRRFGSEFEIGEFA